MFFLATDWRSQSHFGLSIKLWQLSEDEKNREEFNLVSDDFVVGLVQDADRVNFSKVIPETPYAKPFLRSVMALMRSDLALAQETVEAVAQSLAHLLVKEEVVAQMPAPPAPPAPHKHLGETNNNYDEVDREIERIIKDLENKNVSNRNDERDDKIAANVTSTQNAPQGGESRCLQQKTRAGEERAKNNLRQKCPTLEEGQQVKSRLEDDETVSKCLTCKTRHSAADPCARPPYVCGVCNRGFRARQNLRVHALIHLKEEQSSRPHACSECGRRFRHVQTLRRHAAAAHGSRGDTYVCGVCGKGFSVRQYLKRHELSHSGEKRFVCDECGRAFTQSANLRKHRKLMHEGVANFVCDVCGEKFVQKYYWKRHMKTAKHEK